jgi:hypothetical protein
MNPAASGNASGLIVACTLDAPLGTSNIIQDYADAVWHYGAARNVSVSAVRTGAAPGVPSGNVISFCATNNTTAAAACLGGTAPAGNLALSAADVNHSIEAPQSSTTLQGQRITPGSFIVCVGAGCSPALAATKAKLSKPVLNSAAPNAWPNCTGSYVSGCSSIPVSVLVSNDTGRAVTDGVTSAGSGTVTSATMNFKAGDVGAGLSGGDLPDGATIATVNSATSVTLACTGCVGGFTGVSAASGLVLTISPANPPTSSRFVTNGSGAGTRVLTGGAAEFAPSDVGLPINFVPPIATLAGARVGTIAADGSTTTIAGAGAATIPAGAKKFVVGLTTKTAPATGDSTGTLSILLKTDPAVSPTSPPCAANKISGFQIPLSWRNPQGTAVAPATNVLTPGYNTFSGGTHFSGTSQPGVSIAQLDFRTASTSFAAYVQQTYTTVGSVMGASTYRVNYPFLPIGVGVCAGTGLAGTWSFFGLSKKIVENPSFTGGGGGGARGIVSEPQGTSQVYSGGPPLTATSGAYMTVGAPGVNPTNNNSCTVSSPAVIQIGC